MEAFAYGHLPLAWPAPRCFTARAENRPKDQCAGSWPVWLIRKVARVTSQEGEEVFVLNGIQTQSGSCYNLLADLPSMRSTGGYRPLKPPGRASRHLTWLDRYAQAIKQGSSPLPREALEGECNGYWHKIAGMQQQRSGE